MLVAPAVLTLVLALIYAFASGIRSQHPALLTASELLVVCAAFDLASAVLVTTAAVIAGMASEPTGSKPQLVT